MSSSLQDQLLQAGIAKPKQAKKARRDKAQRNKAARKQGQTGTTAEQQLSREVQAAAAAKRAADRQRALKANAEREQRERKRQVIQIIDDNRIKIEAPPTDEPPYSYTLKGKIRRLHVSKGQRQQLAAGRLAIVHYDGKTSLINAATAERLEKLTPKAVFRNTGSDDTPAADDPYAGFEVPDDLMW